MKERIGLIYISTKVFYEEMDNIAKVLSFLEFVPCYVAHEFCCERFKYIGYSSKFEEIEEGAKAPEYQIIIKDVKGKIEYKVCKV